MGHCPLVDTPASPNASAHCSLDPLMLRVSTPASQRRYSSTHLTTSRADKRRPISHLFRVDLRRRIPHLVLVFMLHPQVLLSRQNPYHSYATLTPNLFTSGSILMLELCVMKTCFGRSAPQFLDILCMMANVWQDIEEIPMTMTNISRIYVV